MHSITIVGGGLAGCEAAWQAAARNCKVTLYDMKPLKFSPAHESELLGELVCSNSFRSDDPGSAVGLLKEEMRRFRSLIIQAAHDTAVPAGKALAVDRSRFARKITSMMTENSSIEVVSKEISELPEQPASPWIIATGPLTADGMAASLSRLTGAQRLFFYDAIAPIVEGDSLDRAIIFQKSRYDDGPGDYLNCPMDKDQYLRFLTELQQGTCVPLQSFEDPKYFEGCLPIEIMAGRGTETLRFGPMKPVGLADPRTGLDAYAVVQLRKENLAGSHYNLVGFQTKLTFAEQKRIFRMIPGMERAQFARFGSVHRNTFICAPEVLSPTLQLKKRKNILIAGQLAGVEGYIESAAMGLLAGINAARMANGLAMTVPPPTTAMGALIQHLTATDPRHFQPSNVNFGLFPPLGQKLPKKLRGQARAEKALADLQKYQDEQGLLAENLRSQAE